MQCDAAMIEHRRDEVPRSSVTACPAAVIIALSHPCLTLPGSMQPIQSFKQVLLGMIGDAGNMSSAHGCLMKSWDDPFDERLHQHCALTPPSRTAIRMRSP